MCRTKVIDLNDGVSQYAWYPCTANFQYSHMAQTIFWVKVGSACVIQKSPLSLPVRSFSNRQNVMAQPFPGQAAPCYEECLVQNSKTKPLNTVSRVSGEVLSCDKAIKFLRGYSLQLQGCWTQVYLVCVGEIGREDFGVTWDGNCYFKRPGLSFRFFKAHHSSPPQPLSAFCFPRLFFPSLW